MATIKISKQLKEQLKEKAKYTDTMDIIINNLINDYKENNYNKTLKLNDEMDIIHISEQTKLKLKKLKYYPTETMNNIVFRMINKNKKY